MEKTLPRMLREVSLKYPDVPAQYTRTTKDGDFSFETYKQLFDTSQLFAAGLLALGTVREEKVGLISDNRKEWEQSDMGIMTIGACDVPRGCDASENDLKYILSFTEVKTCVVENSTQIKKIMNVKNDIPTLKQFIIFDQISEEVQSLCDASNVKIYLQI